MSRHPVIAPVVLSLLLGLVRTAAADTEKLELRCTQRSPVSGEMSCEREVEVRRDLADRTHNSIFPTGNLLAGGEVSYQAHELGLLNRASIGVNDNLELSVSAPLFPVFGGIGARVGLLPRESQFRAVVGAGVWLPLMDGGEKLVQGNFTVAHQSERLNLHATVGVFSVLGHDDTLLTYSAGVLYKVGKKSALMGEALHMVFGETAVADCGDCAGGGPETFDGALVGIKLMGEHFDTDLGLFMPFEHDDDDLIGLPVISMTYRY